MSDLFALPDYDDHEMVVVVSDKDSGLQAIIAVHSTLAGPAAGGIRMWNYDNGEEAIVDALRLSRGMTYKNVMAGIPFGGGKSVIIGDSRTEKTPEKLRAFGRRVATLSGAYYCAEDVGISTDDVVTVSKVNPYVCGMPESMGGSGDPSPFTALGCFEGIKAAANFRWGEESLKGRRIAVQGLGHVGWYLCEHLHAQGAELIVADINTAVLKKAEEAFAAKVVATDDIHAQEVDIFTPCALGAIINEGTVDQLKCEIVAGAANNQLSVDAMGTALFEKGILYAPDYVINGGGVVNCVSEINQTYDREATTKRVKAIGDSMTEIFQRSKEKNLPTNEVADHIAEERLQAIKAKKASETVTHLAS